MNAVLFLSMELYDDTVPPKTALVARLVSTRKENRPFSGWTASAMAGNDAPGFLLLGLINDPRVLWGKAKDRVVNSLTVYLSGKTPREVRKAEKKFRPKSFLGTPPKPPDREGYLLRRGAPFPEREHEEECRGDPGPPFREGTLETGRYRRGRTGRGDTDPPPVEDDHGRGAFPFPRRTSSRPL